MTVEADEFYRSINARLDNCDVLALVKAAGIVDERWNGVDRIPCPVCGGNRRFFYSRSKNLIGCSHCSTKDSGFVSVAKILSDCYGGWTEANNFLADYFGITNPFADQEKKSSVKTKPKPACAPPPAQKSQKARDNRDKIKKWWGEAVPATQKPGILLNYFEFRGILPLDTMPDNIRLHPALPYYDTTGEKPVKVGEFPCMLALFDNGKGWGGLHRTWLMPDGFGKASVPGSAKKFLPADSEWQHGIYCRTYPAAAIIAIAEGIETALMIRSLEPALPVYPAYSADEFGYHDPDSICKTLYAFADIDPGEAGQNAAYRLRERLRGRVEVKIIVPDMVDRYKWSKATGGNPNKVDWADYGQWLKSKP